MKPIWEYNASYRTERGFAFVDFTLPEDYLDGQRSSETFTAYLKIVAAFLLRGRGISVEFISDIDIMTTGADASMNTTYRGKMRLIDVRDSYWHEVLRPLIINTYLIGRKRKVV